MSLKQAFKGVILPAASAIAISDGHTLGPHCAKKHECVCRPSELPIYANECSACQAKVPEKPPSEFETTVGKIRKEVWVWQDEMHGYRQRVVDIYNTGVAHTSSSLDFLREEASEPERYGAIAISALSGYILGLRGGKLKRLTYATVGGAAMASFCYPKLAAEYSDLAYQQGTQYFTAGYLFLFGEKPKTPEWLASIIGQSKEPAKGK